MSDIRSKAYHSHRGMGDSPHKYTDSSSAALSDPLRILREGYIQGCEATLKGGAAIPVRREPEFVLRLSSCFGFASHEEHGKEAKEEVKKHVAESPFWVRAGHFVEEV